MITLTLESASFKGICVGFTKILGTSENTVEEKLVLITSFSNTYIIERENCHE